MKAKPHLHEPCEFSESRSVEKSPVMTNFASVNEIIGRHRWMIYAPVFTTTTVDCLHRNVPRQLKPALSAAGVFGTDSR